MNNQKIMKKSANFSKLDDLGIKKIENHINNMKRLSGNMNSIFLSIE